MKKYLNRVEDISRVLNESKLNQSPIESDNESIDNFTPDIKSYSSKYTKEVIKNPEDYKKCDLKWDEIAGLENVKHVLQETIRFKARFLSTSKKDENFWHSLLLYGPPCTGKSFLIKAFCCELNAFFFSYNEFQRKSGLEDRPDKVLEDLFESAKKFVPAVVYIEEIHLVLPVEYDEEISKAKLEFLKFVEGIQNNRELVVIASSTCPWELDPDSRRKFNRRIYVPLPDSATRKEMLREFIADPLFEISHIESLAKLTEGFSSRDLKKLTEIAKSSLNSKNSEQSESLKEDPKVYYKALKSISPSLSLATLTRYQHFTELYGNDQ